MESFNQLLYQLHLSYLEARKNKRNTHNQLAFELNQEIKLHSLAKDISNRKYEINGDSLQLKRLFKQLYLLGFYSFLCA